MEEQEIPPDQAIPQEPQPEPEQPEAAVTMEDLLASTESITEAPAPVSVEDAQIKAVLEALVYVAEEPLTLAQIAAALQQPADRVKALIEQLVTEFDKPEHGVTIREVAGGYKMATKPEHHEAVRAFVKSLKPPLKLSLPALETLAVIAYKQPVTAPEIMEIRGVQGAGVLKTLLDRKLIAAAGRKNVIGKPILYKTTKEFLIQFGLKDLSELPSLKEFEEIRRMAFADSEVPEPGLAASETEVLSSPVDMPVGEAGTQGAAPEPNAGEADSESAADAEPIAGQAAGPSAHPQAGAETATAEPESRESASADSDFDESEPRPDTEPQDSTPPAPPDLEPSEAERPSAADSEQSPAETAPEPVAQEQEK